MNVSKSDFGKTAEGKQVDLYTCVNAHGLAMKVMTWGAIVVEMRVPDREGKLENVTLGFDSLEGYLGDHPYFGATVGRYANRIAGGKFTLDGKTYTLATNNGPNHLHGGKTGFSRVIWDAEPLQDDGCGRCDVHLHQPRRRRGVSGNRQATVVYRLTNDNTMRIDYSATHQLPRPST